MTQIPHPILAFLSLLLFFGIGSLVLAGALWEYRRVSRLTRTGRRVIGTVVEIEEKVVRAPPGSGGRGGGLVWCPVVAFTTDRGMAVRFTAPGRSRRDAFRVQQAVALYYDPEHPEGRTPFQATLDGFWNLWGSVVILGLFGTCSLGFAGFLTWLALR